MTSKFHWSFLTRIDFCVKIYINKYTYKYNTTGMTLASNEQAAIISTVAHSPRARYLRDRLVWEYAQSNKMIIITANRNMKGVEEGRQF